jgi:hypothetical protein
VTGQTRGGEPVPVPDPLEAQLLAAAAAATWPATPDLRGAVLARLEAATPDLRGPVVNRIAGARPPDAPFATPPSRRPIWRPLVRGLALALVALVALAGVAAALGYRLPGLDILFVPSLPPAGAGFDLGSPVPLEEARAGEPPTLRLPSALPAPATAWVTGTGDRRIVTVGWRAEPGQPTLEDSDLSLLLMAIEGRADGVYLSKALGPGTSIEPVTIDGEPGWWISGPVHELLFPRGGGDAGVIDTRLVGDALVFSRDGTLYRFESALGKDATIAIAETLR